MRIRHVAVGCGFVLFAVLPLLAEDMRGIRGSVLVTNVCGESLSLYESSYALVIGNSAYTSGWAAIPGATRDACEVAEALKKQGFEVELKTDLTKAEFDAAFTDLVVEHGRKENARILLYYAGHGHTEQMANNEDMGYLVMTDTPEPEGDRTGFSMKSMDMQTLVTQCKRIRSRHVLFLFDSCFSGTILNLRDRIMPEAISANVGLPVRQFITAGQPKERVPDHSFFKQAFLDLIEGRDKEPVPDGYITGEELGLYLKNKVPEYNKSQHPQFGRILDPKLDKGDFVFVIRRPGVPPSLDVRPAVAGVVVIDGTRKFSMAANARLILNDLEPGLHVVEMTSGDRRWRQEVRLDSGKTTTVEPTLPVVLPRVATMTIRSPLGGSLYIDDGKQKKMMSNQAYSFALNPGRHVVRVESDGREWSRTVNVEPGNDFSLDAVFPMLSPVSPTHVASQQGNWRVATMAGVSSATGVAGVEARWRHLGMCAGYVPEGPVSAGLKYYFRPKDDSWYLGMGGHTSQPEDKTKAEGTIVGVMGGYKWEFRSGLDVVVGVGAGMFSPKDGDATFGVMPDVAVGYAF